METVLSNLNRVEGVIGSAIFGRDGSCQGFLLPEPYEPVLFTEVIHRLHDVSDIYSTLPTFTDKLSCTVAFSGGYLIVRPVDDQLLLLLGATDVNMSMLSVALNVACLKLSRMGKGGAASAPAPTPAAPQRVTAPPVSPQPRVNGASRQSAPLMPSADPSVARARTPSGNWTEEPTTIAGMLFQLHTPQAGPIPSDAVGITVIGHLIKKFAAFYRGNIRLVLQEEFERFGVSPATLRSAQFTDFMYALSAHIEDPNKRDRFIAAALGD